MKKLLKFIHLVVCILLLTSDYFLPQTSTGKLSGKIVDAETKEPLIGANVVILNTGLGAASDTEGNYFILNIIPGTYDVRVSYVGYSPKLIKDVRIVPGVTYQLDINLSSGLLTEEIIVTDKRFFEEKATNTVKVVDANDVAKLPVKGIEGIASLQAGVVTEKGNEGASGKTRINVRGGRSGEVLYIVDGIPQNDIYSGINFAQVSNSAIEQISFQVGGYEAKYGQAQSGVVNVTTKSGTAEYGAFVDVLTSQITDPYGYNLYTGNLSGPIIPGNSGHTFFISVERGWFLDGTPRAVGVQIPTIGYNSDVLPNNSSSVWRMTAKTSHNFGSYSVRLAANINNRMYHDYVHDYVKNNFEHNPKHVVDNYSFSTRFSQNINNNSFWILNLGYKNYKEERGDGVWFNNLEAYGDSAANAALGVTLPNGNGSRVSYDEYGIFSGKGRTSPQYWKNDDGTYTADFSFTSQISNHLFEIGGGIDYNIVRYYYMSTPSTLASENLRNLPVDVKYRRMRPTVFGFDITGKNKTGKDSEFAPKTPVFINTYIQDRYELEDMVLNLGLRFDYFDTKADIIKNPNLPYAGGNPDIFDSEDFITKKPEYHFSPRIGLGFPISENTVFHAQYGRFIQMPSLDQLYGTIIDLSSLISDNNIFLNTGHINSEVTTQYEIGFRQVIANIAALNITAFYKNVQGLINTSVVYYRRSSGGAQLKYITPTNTDFGTVKGLALSLDISRVKYFSLSFNYTYSFAEGTGSSTASSYVAAFRNTNGEIPKVIAPLDFDQRHTGVLNLDFSVPKGDLGYFEMVDANVLVSFSSGRPYTPLESQNLLAGYTNYGDTKGYVNSAYGPGSFSVDLKLEKTFDINNLAVTPYLWIENLFNAKNSITVYQSTGDPYSTGWLSTEEGKKVAASQSKPEIYKSDYIAYERNPLNFSIPRLVKLGIKVNVFNIQF